MGVKCPVDQCTLPIDAYVRCSDSVILGAHTKNLEICSTGIRPTEGSRMAASLNFESDIVALLLKFMHNRLHPDVTTIPWRKFVKLAAAAEEHRVFSALGVCKMYMESSVSRHPYDVFLYASQAGYSDLSEKAIELCVDSHPLECFVKASESGRSSLQDRVAVKILDRPAHEVMSALKESKDANWTATFAAWVLQREEYRNKYRQELQSPPAGNLHKGGILRCDDWYRFYGAVTNEIYESEMSEDPDAVIDSHLSAVEGCKQCLGAVEKWKTNLRDALESLAAFSTFYESVTVTS